MVNDMIDLFIDSAYRITETLRFNELLSVNANTSKLYAVIYDNHSMFVRLETDSRRVDLYKEMMWFATQRTAFLLECIKRYLFEYFNLKNYAIDVTKPFVVNGSNYDINNSVLSRFDLERLEYDIEQTIKIAEQSNDPINFNDESYDFSSERLYNRFEILKRLICLFDNTLIINQASIMNRSSNLIINNINDTGSLRCLVILSYLITKVALSLYKAKKPFDSVSIKEQKHGMIGNDFVNFEKFGMMSLTNVLCCFKNLQYLKIAAENPKVSSSQDVRTFLYNMLIVDKIV